MKKIISLIILTLSLFGGLFVTNIAAKSNRTDYTEAFEVLSRLGIIEVSGINDFDAEEKITRLQFAEYLARTLNIDTKEKKVYFADIGITHSSANIITALVDNGIINGYGDGCFYPDDYLKLTEAYNMIIRALGYGKWAENMGGYPAGYIKAAEQLDIDLLSSGSELTNADALLLLHNACMVNRLMPYSFKGSVVVFDAADNSDIYYTIYGLEYTQGLVTGAGGVDLNDETSYIDEKCFVLDNDEYYLGKDTYDYLGSYVNVFYYPDSKDSDNTVLYISAPEKKNNTLTITSEMFDCCSGNSIEYLPDSDSSRTKKAKLARDAVFCLNRGIFSKSVSTIFDNFNYGTIILKDTDSDDVFDIVIVKSYKNVVVGLVDSDDNVVYNKSKVGDAIKLDNYQTVIIKDISQTELDKDKISENNILSIAESGDGSRIEIIVSYTKISGKLVSVEENDDELYFTVDDKEYLCDSDYKEYLKGLASNGMSYTFNCDAFGRIVYVADIEVKEMLFGYLINAYYDADRKDMPVFKIYNENAKMVKLSCAERVKVDGTIKKKAEDILFAIPDTYKEDKYVIAPQLIRYRTDDGGFIIEIDTSKVVPPKENKESSLSIIDSGTMYYDHISRLGMKTIVNSETKVFKVPKNPVNSTEKSYTINNAVSPYIGYDATAYTINTKNGYAGALVIKTTSLSNLDKESIGISMIADIGEYYSAEDDEVKIKLIYYSRGSRTEKDIDKDVYSENEVFKNLTPGDLCVFGTNPLGEINDVLVLYDYSKYKGEKPTEWKGYVSDSGMCWYNTAQGARSNLTFGYVNQKTDSILRLGYSKFDGYDEAHLISGNVMIYDSTLRKNNVYTIPVSQIRDYMSVGYECDKAIIHTRDYRTYNGFFVYR